jgi:putative ABC transport system permease protein
MRFLILNHLHNARQSLRSNRLRSMLTMVGITIGVASITTILALSGGASQIVVNQVDELGGNIAVVRPGATSDEPLDDLAQFPSRQYFSASTLTWNDLLTIQGLPNVEAAAPLMVLTGAIEGSNPAPANTPIVATTPDLALISDLKIRDGQFLDPALRANTAVIGPQLAVDIFGTDQAIGKTVTIKGTDFTVIGVLRRANNPINYNGIDFDSAVIVNEESRALLNQPSLQIQQINVRSTSVDTLSQVIVDINKSLLRNHVGEKDFSVLTGEEIARPTNQLFYAIAGATAAIAAISLLVGGVGIMNIMLVSVAERTREIGIRKALGASNRDIVAQFLIESLALSIGGGISGYVLGYVAAFLISTFLTFDPIINWETAGVAVGLSIVTGTLFGLYPAFRAARKDPIDALRQYD